MRRLLFALPVAIAGVLAVYFVLALDPGRDPQVLPSVLIDKPAPQFRLPSLDGGPGLALSSLKGQVAVINFFASWCSGCRSEHRLLMQWSRATGVHLYGIAYKDKPADTERFLQRFGDPYRTVGRDEDGRTAIDFGVYGVPETYVIDKRGRIRQRYVGPLTGSEVSQQLLPLLQRLR